MNSEKIKHFHSVHENAKQAAKGLHNQEFLMIEALQKVDQDKASSW